MPITSSASKKMRRDARKRAATLGVKITLKKLVKVARQKPITENLKAAQAALDKAAKTGLIHQNKAARLKSRLSKNARQTSKR